MKYVVITPAKNEEKYIEQTIISVCSQTIRPQQWFIVDDNSNDSTVDIISKYSKIHNWIKFIPANNIDVQEKGARIAKIINNIVSLIECEYEYIIKLDADITFEKDFFKNILKEFEERPKLGIASGRLIYNNEIEKVTFTEFTRGATKVYRKESRPSPSQMRV